MEPRLLKEHFGDRIVFWGAVDVQHFLPRAFPEDIPEHIDELIRVMGRGGGYVMAPAHEILGDIPTENIIAWVEALKGYN
jgi:uroporphyrinogen decarboxylase